MGINYDKARTYMASASFTAAAAGTDIFTITGSADSNIYILKAGIGAVSATAGGAAIVVRTSLIKRSTANTAGTAVAATEVPLQSGALAADGTVVNYTANPTLGADVGNVFESCMAIPLASTPLAGHIVVNFESMLGHPLALLSATEVLAWSLGGATVVNNTFYAWVQWAETSKT